MRVFCYVLLSFVVGVGIDIGINVDVGVDRFVDDDGRPAVLFAADGGCDCDGLGGCGDGCSFVLGVLKIYMYG